MGMLSSISKKIAGQLDKPFYIWAVLAGPIWAQNITIFLLWLYAVLLLLAALGTRAMEETNLVKAAEDKEWAKEQIEKEHWVWRIPGIAVVITLAAVGWFWTAGAFASAWLLMIIILYDKRSKIEEIIDDAEGKST